MSLPKVITPEYTVKLWSRKDPVRFRPYLVREEKILLTAKQGGDEASIMRAVVQVLKNCTFGEVDIDALPSFDLEYLFLHVRMKSVSETSVLHYACQNIVRAPGAEPGDDGRCKNRVTLTVDLNKIVLDVPTETPDSHITLQDGTVVAMRYPTLKDAARLPNSTTAAESIAAAIVSITDVTGTLYEARDHSTEELVDFVDSIGVNDLRKFEVFFDHAPSLKYTTSFKCEKCGYEQAITFEGLSDFFT